MNGIEFKIAREGLHLTQQELADLWAVSLRTVQRWEKGKFTIPNDRAEQLTMYYVDIYKAFGNFCGFIEKQKLSKTDEVYLLAYNADNYDGDFEHFKLHFKLLEECKFHLQDKVKVKIVEMDEPAYCEWLGTREDTQQARATWASFQ